MGTSIKEVYEYDLKRAIERREHYREIGNDLAWLRADRKVRRIEQMLKNLKE